MKFKLTVILKILLKRYSKKKYYYLSTKRRVSYQITKIQFIKKKYIFLHDKKLK